MPYNRHLITSLFCIAPVIATIDGLTSSNKTIKHVQQTTKDSCELIASNYPKSFSSRIDGDLLKWKALPHESTFTVLDLEGSDFDFNNFQTGINNIQFNVSRLLETKLLAWNLKIVVFNSPQHFLNNCSFYSNPDCEKTIGMFDPQKNTIVISSWAIDSLYHEYVHAIFTDFLKLESEKEQDIKDFNYINESLANFFSTHHFTEDLTYEKIEIKNYFYKKRALEVFNIIPNFADFKFLNIPNNHTFNLRYYLLPKIYEFWMFHDQANFHKFINALKSQSSISETLFEIEKLIQSTNHCQFSKFLDRNN